MAKNSDDDGVVVHLTPRMSDEDIVAILNERMANDIALVDEIVEDLNRTISAAENREPYDPIIAYGKMGQYLRSLSHAQVLHLLAGALWKLAD